MPCQIAMITDVVTVKPEMSVEDALHLLEEKRIRAVPVVDDNHRLVGMFSFKQLLNKLLPVSATMEDGLQRLNFVIGTAPAVAKKLRKIKGDKVENHLNTEDVVVLHPETPTWETLRLIVRHGSPLPIITPSDGRLVGLLTEQSLLESLESILEDLDGPDDLDA